MSILSDAYHEWREKSDRELADLLHDAACKSPFGGQFFGALGDFCEDVADVHAQGGLKGIFLKAFLGSFSVDRYLDDEAAQQCLASRIRQNLDSGNYNKVNIGLTAEVSDINTVQDNTRVTFDVECGEDECKVELRTQYGTSLEVGDRLSLTV